MHAKPVALVTGANKGLGYEIARQLARKGYTVVLGARDAHRGSQAAARLKAEGLDAEPVQLDVTDPTSVARLPGFLQQRYGRLDVLVNNAGVLLDGKAAPSELDEGVLRQTFDTNFFGAFGVARAVLPLLRRSPAGRVVNMSSTLGSLTEMTDPASDYDGFNGLAYSASKAALNMLTAALAKELRGSAVKVNSACPGWVKTDMGSQAAPLTVEQGADTPVWLATLPEDGPTGGFFRARQRIAW